MATTADPFGEIRAFRGWSIGLIVALIGQFLLGMAVNLFVTVPTNHPGAHPAEYFSGVAQSVAWALVNGHVLLSIHAAMGLGLVVGAIAALVVAIRSRRRRAIVATSFGAFGVLSAGFNGGSFLNYHEDFSSMLMAAGLAVALLSYSLGLFAAPNSVTR